MENLTTQLPSTEEKTESIPQTRRWKSLQRFLKYLSPVTGLLLLAQTVSMPTPAWVDIEGIQNKDAQTSTEYLVDVIIHRSLPQDQAEEWAKDAVDNYLNRRFAESRTSKRFKVDQVFRDYDERTSCSIPGTFEVYDRCDSTDGKIRVWLHQNDIRYKGILTETGANPTSASVQQELPSTIEAEQDNYFGQRPAGDTLVHEVGHLFGLPDYYQEEVNPNLNQVAPVGIIPFAEDVMYNQNTHNDFSDISRNYIERVNQLPIGFGETQWSLQFTPKQTVLQVVDDENIPLNGVKIDVFPERYVINTIGQIGRTIPNVTSLTGYSDETGQLNLGSYHNLFDSSESTDQGTQAYFGSAAFLRISSSTEIRYAAITRSYLNYLYFQGYENTALISVPFSSLLKLEEGKRSYLSAPGVPPREF